MQGTTGVWDEEGDVNGVHGELDLPTKKDLLFGINLLIDFLEQLSVKNRNKSSCTRFWDRVSKNAVTNVIEVGEFCIGEVLGEEPGHGLTPQELLSKAEEAAAKLQLEEAA